MQKQQHYKHKNERKGARQKSKQHVLPCNPDIITDVLEGLISSTLSMAHNALLYKRVIGTKILYFNSRHLFIQNRDSLVFCVVFSRWFSFGPFSFRHCFLYPSLVYGF